MFLIKNSQPLQVLIAVLLLLIPMGCQELEPGDDLKRALKKTKLPIIYLKSSEAIPYQNKIPCEFSYEEKRKQVKGQGRIRRRGGQSASYPKRSYTLKTNKRRSFAQLATSKEWIFNASFIDKTFMRHKLSYDLFMDMQGENLAPKSSYIHLFLGEEYKGLYLLKQRVNEELLGIDEKDPRAVVYKDPPIFTTPERLSHYELEPNDPWFQKFPKEPSPQFNQEMQAFRDYLLDSPDSLFFDLQTGIQSKIYLPNVIDWHLFLLLSNNVDGLVKNFYLFRRKAGAPFRIALWDCDHTFGRDGDGELNMFRKMIEPEKNILLRRLNNNPAYQKQLKERWLELRAADIISEKTLLKKIERIHQKIQTSIPLNRAVWSDDHSIYYDKNNYDQEVQIIKDYLQKRLVQLDETFE